MSDTAPSFLRLLILGPPKGGKTYTTLTTAPEGGIFLINSDQKGAAAAPMKLRNNIVEGFAEDPQKLETALGIAFQGVKGGAFNTIVWDTVTEYARKTQYLCEDADKNGMVAWQKLSRFVMNPLDRLIRANCHIVVIAHSRVSENGGIELDMPGQAGRRVPASFSDVWMLDSRGTGANVERVFTKRKGGHLASRTLHDVSEVPGNVAGLWDKLK